MLSILLMLDKLLKNNYFIVRKKVISKKISSANFIFMQNYNKNSTNVLLYYIYFFNVINYMNCIKRFLFEQTYLYNIITVCHP